MSETIQPPARRLAIRAGIVTVLGLALVVVVPRGLGGTAEAAPLTPFSSCDELAGWFADTAREYVGPYRLGGGDQLEAVDLPVSAAAATDDARASAPTGTNIQEVGVDEPDLIKTDGSRVVAVRQGTLSVVDVSGAAPRLLGALGVGEAQELLLVGERALVFRSQWNEATGAGAAVLTVVDLSDPARPAVQRTEQIDGTYLSAREHDGAVRVVLTSTPALPLVYPEGGRTEEQATTQNRAIIDATPAQGWLPQRVVLDAGGNEISRGPLLDCDQVTHPVDPAGLGVLTVLTIDLQDPAAPMSEPLAVAADGDMVYASTDRLYVATTRGGWGFPRRLDAAVPGGPVGIFPVPTQQPITTALHGFDISSRTITSYLASGSVEGSLLGRWALSAEGGYLRVATTRGGALGQDSDSAVTVLAENGRDLTVVGSVGGLGRGEQIRAVRWFGDLATVVTFQQTDPLYTVDLSDPAAPTVLGELAVTGYSGYLHPLGDGLLLGVGQDASATGQVTGAKIAIFDLRDLAHPTLVDSVVQPGAWAEAESDSRAFTYLPEERVAVTSISTQSGSELWSVSIGSDGALHTAAQWSSPPNAWLARAIPVSGGRMVALSDSENGVTLTVLALTGLTPTGAVQLG